MLEDYVSVIVATKDPLQERTQKCLAHLARSTAPYELILLNRNREWTTGTIINQGIAASVGEYVTFCCDDCFVDPNALEEMKRELEDPEVGVVGALLQYPNGFVQHAGGYVRLQPGERPGITHIRLRHIGQGQPMKAYATEDVEFVTGALMMTRRDVIEVIGQYAHDCRLCWGDVDFCFRARKAGYRVRFVASAQGVHLEASTRGQNKNLTQEDAQDVNWFLSRWGHSPFVLPNQPGVKEQSPIGLAAGGSR